MFRTIDRLKFAKEISTGRRVLDIGGQKMENCDPDSPFAKVYGEIEQVASEYMIVDYQRQPAVDFVIDFNQPKSIQEIRETIDQTRPEIILCMETLEHINYHFELMNELARAVDLYKCCVFITVPNNGNWVFNAMGWNRDHSTAFFRDIAYRFAGRSDLGNHHLLMSPCMQKYLWYWKFVYVLSLFQPFSWGVLAMPTPVPEHFSSLSDVKFMEGYTRSKFRTTPK